MEYRDTIPWTKCQGGRSTDNGKPTVPPFAFNVADTVYSQLASEAFDSVDLAVQDVAVQDLASSSTNLLYATQGGSSSSAQASLVRRQPFSLKGARQRGGSPPSKFAFAAPRQK